MSRFRERLTYANVMSSIAVFLVLGGATAFAASNLGKNSVGSKQIKKNAVTAAKIKNNAVTAAKIKNNAVTAAKIANDAVTGAKIPDGSVTASKIGAGAVTGAKIGAGAVGSAQLGAAAVDSSKLAAGAVGAANLAESSVGNAQTSLAKVFKAGPVPAGADEASAPRVELGSVGPFRFYGKCFLEAGNVRAVQYIELTAGVATLGSEGGTSFSSNTTGYLTPISPENKRMMKTVTAAANNFNAGSFDEEFQASASDGTEITGLIGGIGAKQGSPPEGDGPFLPGNSCIIGTIAIFGN